MNDDYSRRHQSIFHDSTKESALCQLEDQQLHSSSLIVASLYDASGVLNGVYMGLSSRERGVDGNYIVNTKIDAARPPNVEALYNIWMGQPKDSLDWQIYERDMCLINAFDEFSMYEITRLETHDEWRQYECNYLDAYDE